MKKEDLEKLPVLSKIHCSEKEMEELLESLLSILQYMRQLDEIDVEDIPPCDHVLEHISNVFQEDEIGEELLDRQVFLENSPDYVGGMIKVPSVIKF